MNLPGIVAMVIGVEDGYTLSVLVTNVYVDSEVQTAAALGD